MEYLAGARIALTPRPVQRREAALEAALLGHCPGRVRLERLLVLTGALDDLRAAGFGPMVEALIAGQMPQGGPLTAQLAGLYHLPLSLRSSAEFHDIFPDAATAPCAYESLLAGNRAWLPQAVDDFFANGGEKLWVVRIPEGEAQAGFLPASNTLLHDVDTLRGLASVLVIPALAVVAMPDLERLQIPPRLPDVPRVRLANPQPQFLPCGKSTEDDHRERRYPSELSAMPEPRPLEELLRGILQFIARYRPDVQCLLTLPLAYSGEIDSPVVDRRALERISAIRDASSGHLLRHVQFLFPYLRGPRFALHTPVGVIAGKQADTARAKGPWHSIGAQPLVTEALPYPRLSIAQMLDLREKPGIGVLQQRTGFSGYPQLSLDDERLVVPALPPADYSNAQDMRQFDGFRSAEVMRFLGFLRRQLQALGEQLVFNVDVDDPRPRLLLEQFFRNLYNRGALRGRIPEEGFQIKQSQPGEGTIQFDIQIAPAFPIDRIYLTFINIHGEWQAEVTHG
ncbi:MAG: hypothetical protein AB1810_03520 [Pseudomonadota bacterium]